MRQLFAALLVYSCPNNPRPLWLKFENIMSKDLLWCPMLTIGKVRKTVLQQIIGSFFSFLIHAKTYKHLWYDPYRFIIYWYKEPNKRGKSKKEAL